MGSPVIATKIGGNLEIIEDGENGFLIENNKIQRQLIVKIEHILKNRDMLSEMSKKAIDYIKNNHTEQTMVKKFNTFVNNFE